MCVPNGPLFQQKVYDWPHFSGFLYRWPHFSAVSRHMHIFFVQRFFEAACSLGIQCIDCDICLTIRNKWVQKSKGSIWMGQHFRRSSIWMVLFFKGQEYEWGRLRNTGSNTCTTITHKLPTPRDSLLSAWRMWILRYPNKRQLWSDKPDSQADLNHCTLRSTELM